MLLTKPLCYILLGQHNLAVNDEEAQEAVAAAGAIPPLISLMQNASPDLQAKAAATIWSIAGTPPPPTHTHTSHTLARLLARAPSLSLLGRCGDHLCACMRACVRGACVLALTGREEKLDATN